jgi:hypothetical protein
MTDHAGWLLYPFVSLQSLIEKGCGLGWEGREAMDMSHARLFACLMVCQKLRVWLLTRGVSMGSLSRLCNVEQWSWRDRSVRQRLLIVVELYILYEKVQAVNCETNSIRVTFPSMSSLMSEIRVISLRSSEPRGPVWLLPASLNTTVSLSVHASLKLYELDIGSHQMLML